MNNSSVFVVGSGVEAGGSFTVLSQYARSKAEKHLVTFGKTRCNRTPLVLQYQVFFSGPSRLCMGVR